MLARTPVSIIIPAKNEELYIGACLDSISTLLQRRVNVSEIVVVDNFSTDRTNHIARSRGAKVVETDSRRIGEIRNIGARYASGEIIAYIDADCTAPPDWLENALEHYYRARSEP